MRKVFNNRELCHVFMSQSQESGRGSNMFFEGDTIYSYGGHFPLAKIFKNEKVVYFNSARYSKSTSKHQSYMSSAIDKDYLYILGDYICRKDPEEVQKILYENILDSLSDLFSSLITYEYHIEAIYNSIKKYHDHAEAFKIKVKDIILPKELSHLLGEYFVKAEQDTKKLEERRENKRAKRAVEWAKELEQRKIRQALYEKEYLEKLEAWKAGAESEIYYSGPVFLSVKENQVETSKGARVPLDQAIKLFKRIKNNEVLEGEKIGAYSYNRTENGTIKIGCHDIEMNEADRVLGSLISEVQ
jgi:hypothetical protein